MTDNRNEIFIEFEYNGREIDGVENFKSELNESYLVQGRSIYIPSFSEGGETWFNIFINSSFFEFAKDVVVYGFAWDLLKKGTEKYFLKPFYEALLKLKEVNKETYKLRIIRMKFKFDDVIIVLGGIDPNRISVISIVFNEIAKRKAEIERDVGLPINKIETPIFHNPSIDKKGYSPYLLDTEPKNKIEDYIESWKIWFMDDSECKIYNLKENSYKEAYPN
jgi:hypothetical protein